MDFRCSDCAFVWGKTIAENQGERLQYPLSLIVKVFT